MPEINEATAWKLHHFVHQGQSRRPALQSLAKSRTILDLRHYIRAVLQGKHTAGERAETIGLRQSANMCAHTQRLRVQALRTISVKESKEGKSRWCTTPC